MSPAPIRERILDAAALLLVQEGPQTRMQTIARQAGVAIGSVYNHFDSKEDLLRSLYSRLADQLERAVVLPAEPVLAPQVRLQAYLESYIDFFWQDPARAVLFELLSCLPLVSPAELKAHFAASAAYIAGVLADCARIEGISLSEPGEFAGFLGGALRNSLKWRRSRPHEPLSGEERARLCGWCLAALRGGA